jgi:hypothetical protein
MKSRADRDTALGAISDDPGRMKPTRRVGFPHPFRDDDSSLSVSAIFAQGCNGRAAQRHQLVRDAHPRMHHGNAVVSTTGFCQIAGASWGARAACSRSAAPQPTVARCLPLIAGWVRKHAPADFTSQRQRRSLRYLRYDPRDSAAGRRRRVGRGTLASRTAQSVMGRRTLAASPYSRRTSICSRDHRPQRNAHLLARRMDRSALVILRAS